jgi:uracil-DNA glycosylase family 4
MSDKVTTLGAMEKEVSSCTRCPLHESRTHTVFGEGAVDADILVVGEAPGKDEDISGRPFVGRSGRLLRDLLNESLGESGVDIFIANLVKCRPPNNRNPESTEIEACVGYLYRQIETISPKVVLAVGAFAAKTLLSTKLGVGALRGQIYYDGKLAVAPSFHPAAALRGGPSVVTKIRADLALVNLFLKGEVQPCPYP